MPDRTLSERERTTRTDDLSRYVVWVDPATSQPAPPPATVPPIQPPPMPGSPDIYFEPQGNAPFDLGSINLLGYDIPVLWLIAGGLAAFVIFRNR